jgi:hypothetical protein
MDSYFKLKGDVERMEKVVNINALRKLKELDEFIIDELNMEMS